MNGVVHVGAHMGEEVPRYIAEGRDPIICFEPQEKIWLHGKVVGAEWAPFALGTFPGRVELRIPCHHASPERDTQSASLLPLDSEAARNIGWQVMEHYTEWVTLVRFDTWAKGLGFNLMKRSSFSLLVIDVQGMELQVLEGFGSYLPLFEKVVVECSDPPLYIGGASARLVEQFMLRNGYERRSEIVPHGDVTYVLK